jgi:hypothetical protein
MMTPQRSIGIETFLFGRSFMHRLSRAAVTGAFLVHFNTPGLAEGSQDMIISPS